MLYCCLFPFSTWQFIYVMMLLLPSSLLCILVRMRYLWQMISWLLPFVFYFGQNEISVINVLITSSLLCILLFWSEWDICNKWSHYFFPFLYFFILVRMRYLWQRISLLLAQSQFIYQIVSIHKLFMQGQKVSLQ